MGSIGEPEIKDIECLVVGGGFGAVALLRKLLQNGFEVRVYEKGSSFGGIWHWNCYPGARVDTESPVYQFFEKKLYDDFTYSERYPSWKDLRSYFEHVDRIEGLRKHFDFHKNVDSAVFHQDRNKWLITCSDGTQTWCRWFLPCLGFASKKYIPRIPGMGNFHGEIHHTGAWPQHGINLKGKRIALIGTGATGIQCSQEIGDDAGHLTIYQRTANMTLPMNQHKLDPAEERKKKDNGQYDEEFEKCKSTFTGLPYDFLPKNALDDTPEERYKTYYDLMITQGGFRYWLGNYKDTLFVQASNDEAYKFWRDETRKRIKDPKKQKILVPDEPPHPIGTKRMSLEQRFYEVVDQPHVDIIDISKSPIECIEEEGIRTKDEGVVPVDIIILATGFDGVSGSLGQLNIRDVEGNTIADHWKDGLRTAMGISIPGFPNMFFIYGPQAPTAFANGPTMAQYQSDWIVDMLLRARKEGFERIEAKPEAEEDWVKKVHQAWDITLFPKATGWYTGANIPGKKIEPLNFAGGIVPYFKTLYDSFENEYQSWNTVKAH